MVADNSKREERRKRNKRLRTIAGRVNHLYNSIDRAKEQAEDDY